MWNCTLLYINYLYISEIEIKYVPHFLIVPNETHKICNEKYPSYILNLDKGAEPNLKDASFFIILLMVSMNFCIICTLQGIIYKLRNMLRRGDGDIPKYDITWQSTSIESLCDITIQYLKYSAQNHLQKHKI